MWLIHHESPTKVRTYAYVNPVVAVLLGYFLGGEAGSGRAMATLGKPAWQKRTRERPTSCASGAQLALDRNEASKVIEALQGAAPYELGRPGYRAFLAPALHPVYVRREAYLAAHQGSEAAAEFQKILDHRGVVLNEPIGALAPLGLARAYAMQGDSAKARAAYQDFLTLWKEADPNIPILREAKGEYAKLK